MSRADVRTVVGIVVGTALLVLLPGAFAEAGDGLERHAGRIHSMSPADGLLMIEGVGANATEQVVWVQVAKAEVVRIWRDPNQAWEWRERLVRLQMFPAGTLVIVIGYRDSSGVVQATRVEVPKIEPLREEAAHVW